MTSPALPAGPEQRLYRAAQLRELDRLAIEQAGIPGRVLMERAGTAAFEVLRARFPGARRIGVVCGSGNNGGDGFVVARLASAAGLQVAVALVGDRARMSGDAAAVTQAYQDAGGKLHALETALAAPEVVIDGLLGTGLTREVQGRYREAVDAINAHPAPVLALDVPSGLSADTGMALGVAVRAAVTVTFIGLKQGLVTGRAAEFRGELHLEDLGVPEAVFDGVVPAALRIDPRWLSAVLPPRPRAAHKGCYGHVLVIGGDHGMAGAARMAAEAAARVGAGLVSVATRADHAPLVSVARPELMSHGVESASALTPLLQRASVVAIGPGLGRSQWARALLGRILETRVALVVDADALNLLADDPLQRADWTLTPHPGEAARLLECSTAEIQQDRYAAAAELARRFGACVVLKGAGTLIAAAGETTAVCDAGNPGMASGGMGDVLTGVLAGLRAQGLDGLEAARAGVCVHALAADAAAARGERGLLASDLFAHLRAVVNPALEA